jgi:hypothetical protein
MIVRKKASGRRRIQKSNLLQKIFNSHVSKYLFWFMFACINFGHKAINCGVNRRKKNNFESHTQNGYTRRPSETQRRNYNKFESLRTKVE